MTDHAILPPSSASEWGNCDAWLRLNEAAPEPPETDEARWGTECHALAQLMLEAHKRRAEPPPRREYDPEMYETAKLYADHCGRLMAEHHIFGGKSLGIEARVHMKRVHPGAVWGTSDFYLYDYKGHVLYVRDLKSGHLLCEPDDEQLMLYAAGAIEALGLNELTVTVDLGIVQPRGFHRDGPIRTVRMPASDMRARLNQLAQRAEANLARDGKATAGEHCYNCNARTRCPAALALGPQLLQLSTEGVPTEPSASEVGLLLTWTQRAIKYLRQMEKAYEGELEGHLRAGRIVPGWAIESAEGREYWTADREQVLAVGALFNVTVDKPELITPAQARKAGIPSEIINLYCTRRNNGTKLVEQTDKSAAVIFNQPRETN